MLLAFLGLTSPMGCLAMEGTCGPSGTDCLPMSPWNDKSGLIQMKMNVHAGADDNSSAVDMSNSTPTAIQFEFMNNGRAQELNGRSEQGFGDLQEGGIRGIPTKAEAEARCASDVACKAYCWNPDDWSHYYRQHDQGFMHVGNYGRGWQCFKKTALYAFGATGRADCPAGYGPILSDSDCEEAAESMGFTWNPGMYLNWCPTGRPKGCFLYVPHQEVFNNDYPPPCPGGVDYGNDQRLCRISQAVTTTTTTTQAPQNCAGVWGGWSTCSASCGGGTQSRSFTVQRNPAYGGSHCPGPQAQPCNADACPVDCAGVWGGWIACSASCGGGTQSRSFTVQRSPADGGSSCPSPETQPCNADACPVDCVGAWEAWSTCSSPCGGGQQSRSYAVATHTANGGVQCPPPQSQPCSPHPCPVNCAGSWDAWSLCSAECGGGTQTRTFNVATAAAHGGTECPTLESQRCSSSPCPVHCQGSFTPWAPCSVSCGGGTQARTFNISSQATNGGDDCPASPESQACNSRECAVDCAGSWQEWGPCSLDCGGGTRSRIFTEMIRPAFDGVACPTSPDSQACNAHTCPVDCDGSWEVWGPCSRECGCGGGTQSAAFDISVPASDGGRACPTSPKSQVCNNHACDNFESSTNHPGCQGISTTPSPSTEALTSTGASNQGVAAST